MIACMTGLVREILRDSIILDVNGIGFQLLTPAYCLDKWVIGETAFLFTTLIVREESLTLVGFDTQESKEVFLMLLSVNGIGIRLALAILSALSLDVIRRAIFHDQADIFSRVPGVGKKTAQKILLTLKDKIQAESGLEPISMVSDTDAEVLAALTALGYSIIEAQSAIQAIPRDTNGDVETRIRLALSYFVKP